MRSKLLRSTLARSGPTLTITEAAEGSGDTQNVADPKYTRRKGMEEHSSKAPW